MSHAPCRHTIHSGSSEMCGERAPASTRVCGVHARERYSAAVKRIEDFTRELEAAKAARDHATMLLAEVVLMTGEKS